MIWNILSKEEITVKLPTAFNATSLYRFIDKAIDEQCGAKCSKIYFDFSTLSFIEPVGVVVLSNLIEYFKKIGVKVAFKGHTVATKANTFLDDAGFFSYYLKHYIFESSSQRSTTKALKLVSSGDATSYLYFTLMPWIGQEVELSEESLSALRTSIEEIFHNIRDHSGVGIGCVFAQHYPQKKEIQIAISDFGEGIPTLVRTKLPNITSDTDALRQACQEGFSTQSNVRNRGAGLSNLMRYITLRNNGTVLISSGKAQISAVHRNSKVKMTARESDGFYPGTLVRAILRTDTLEQVTKDIELEVFEW
jgi:anti-sigma regulatory factor (Ser/Thr protein kinase)/anti-anti-sigma regulatory factor